MLFVPVFQVSGFFSVVALARCVVSFGLWGFGCKVSRFFSAVALTVSDFSLVVAVKVSRFFSVVALKVGRFFFGCGTEGRSFLFGCGGFGSKVRGFVSPSSRGRDRFGPGAYLFVVLGMSTFGSLSCGSAEDSELEGNQNALPSKRVD